MAGVIRETTQAGGVSVGAYSAFSGINTVSSADYTGTDTDGYSRIHISTGASDRTYTPPTASADNAGRVIHLMKTDTGAGGLIVGGTISGVSTASVNTITQQYGRASIVSDGSAWYWQNEITEEVTSVVNCSSGASGAANLTTAIAYTLRAKRNGRSITANLIAASAGTKSTNPGYVELVGIIPAGWRPGSLTYSGCNMELASTNTHVGVYIATTGTIRLYANNSFSNIAAGATGVGPVTQTSFSWTTMS